MELFKHGRCKMTLEKAIAKLKVAIDAIADEDGTESGLVPLKTLLPVVVNDIDQRFEGIAPKLTNLDLLISMQRLAD